MSNKMIIGVTAAAALVFAMVPASFAKKVDCYGSKGAADATKSVPMSAKKCKKEGGTLTAPAAATPATPAEAPATSATTEKSPS